jgi:hypothetical protein
MKKVLLLTAALLLAAPAKADTLTVGWWDQALGGGVTPIASSTSGLIDLLYQGDQPIFLGGGFGFDQIAALLTPPGGNSRSGGLGGTNLTFEFAWNDGFVPPQGGTIRLYATWQGALTADNKITLPSSFSTDEMPGGKNGLTVGQQIFVCGNGARFCDNSVVGGGTLVGSTVITDQALSSFPTLSGIAPGQPFAISEVFTFSQDRASFPSAVQGDVGAAIMTTPEGVPGPIVGVGLPGLIAACGVLLALARRRRQLVVV